MVSAIDRPAFGNAAGCIPHAKHAGAKPAEIGAEDISGAQWRRMRAAWPWERLGKALQDHGRGQAQMNTDRMQAPLSVFHQVYPWLETACVRVPLARFDGERARP